MLRSRIADMVRRITDIKKIPKVAAISWREIAYRHIGVIGAQPPADYLKRMTLQINIMEVDY